MRPFAHSRARSGLRCELPAQTAGGLRWPPAPAKHQGGRFEVPDAPCGGLRPLTIFHAFDWRFHGVKWKLDDLRNAGCVRPRACDPSARPSSRRARRPPPRPLLPVHNAHALPPGTTLCRSRHAKSRLATSSGACCVLRACVQNEGARKTGGREGGQGGWEGTGASAGERGAHETYTRALPP